MHSTDQAELFLVADGIGGKRHREIVSRMSGMDTTNGRTRDGLSFQQMITDNVYENFLDRTADFQAASTGKFVGAVGIRLTPECSVWTVPLRKGDQFFLCSDGAYRYIPDQKLQSRILFHINEPCELVEGISQIIETSGAEDNYSIIYVKVFSV